MCGLRMSLQQFIELGQRKRTAVYACWRKRCTSGLAVLPVAAGEASEAAAVPGFCSGSPKAPCSISGCSPHVGLALLHQPH